MNRPMIKNITLIALALMVVAGITLGLMYRSSIVSEPGDHLSRDYIRNVIAQESPVLFNDGKTRIGVFFAREHRTYLAYDEVPRSWVLAITAAEDQRFWSHPGVDIWGIARAMLRNIQAGRMVAGGSTLTQQTAKNLYYRPDRSLGSKWTELLNALRLEAHYSKEDILEFYANQFHVSSNGRGLGIAARYFFDKEVSDLGTLECAFLAGLVKAPARYNPFIGKTEPDRQRALDRAHQRTHYVLDRMHAEGVLTDSVHGALVKAELPFKKGKFQYESNVILDEVESRLSQPPFPALFATLEIDNPSTAGISIVTTLDEAAQTGATHALWHHLTEVGTQVEGMPTPSFTAGPAMRAAYDPGRSMAPGTFHTGVGSTEDGQQITLPGGQCRLDKKAIQRAANVLARAAASNSWAVGKAAQRSAVQARVRSGEPMLVSVRSEGADGRVCDLEHRPLLQGAVLLLERGRVRAMVGGNDNQNFNRAINAKRQLGSIWKPVLYKAALQLGWSTLDVVDNRSNVFHFEGTWYYPRADHDNVPWTTLGWLGPRSENLGSIWLLMHLMDRLSPQQFQAVSSSLGLTRTEDEDYTSFVRRIRDDEGVISTHSRLNEIVFTAARTEVLAEMEPDDPEAWELRSLFYGRGLDKERKRVAAGPRAEQHLAALERSYRTLAQRGTRCIAQAKLLTESIASARGGALSDATGAEDAVNDWYTVTPELPDFTEMSELAVEASSGRLLCGQDLSGSAPVNADAWWSWVRGEADVPSVSDLQVNGSVSIGTLTRLHGVMKRRLLVWAGADPYDWDVLQYHPDFRTLVGLRYMDQLAQSYGVKQPLPPVLSLPLGAVDISLSEAAMLYQSMMEGEVRRFFADTSDGEIMGPDRSSMLIQEIRDRDGTVLYRIKDDPTPRTISVQGRQIGDVLRNVVRWGTGRRALNEVTVNGAVVPVAGKTGTTNGYRNAAFAGFVPRLIDGAWAWAEGYTLVSYLGYDDNRPMRKGSVRLQGSNGALPVWIGTARALGAGGLLGMPDAETPPEWNELAGFGRMQVSESAGMRLDERAEEGGRTVLYEGGSVARRRFEPVGLPAAMALGLGGFGHEGQAPSLEDPVDELWTQMDSGIADPSGPSGP
jgi:penicillin-binding protein 1A